MKWRTGSEARISCLKRDYGWRRTRIDGTAGAQMWCAWGVLATWVRFDSICPPYLGGVWAQPDPL